MTPSISNLCIIATILVLTSAQQIPDLPRRPVMTNPQPPPPTPSPGFQTFPMAFQQPLPQPTQQLTPPNHPVTPQVQPALQMPLNSTAPAVKPVEVLNSKVIRVEGFDHIQRRTARRSVDDDIIEGEFIRVRRSVSKASSSEIAKFDASSNVDVEGSVGSGESSGGGSGDDILSFFTKATTKKDDSEMALTPEAGHRNLFDKIEGETEGGDVTHQVQVTSSMGLDDYGFWKAFRETKIPIVNTVKPMRTAQPEEHIPHHVLFFNDIFSEDDDQPLESDVHPRMGAGNNVDESTADVDAGWRVTTVSLPREEHHSKHSTHHHKHHGHSSTHASMEHRDRMNDLQSTTEGSGNFHVSSNVDPHNLRVDELADEADHHRNHSAHHHKHHGHGHASMGHENQMNNLQSTTSHPSSSQSVHLNTSSNRGNSTNSTESLSLVDHQPSILAVSLSESRVHSESASSNVSTKDSKMVRNNPMATLLFLDGRIAEFCKANAFFIIGAVMAVPAVVVLLYFIYRRRRRGHTGSLNVSPTSRHMQKKPMMSKSGLRSTVCSHENELPMSPRSSSSTPPKPPPLPKKQ